MRYHHLLIYLFLIVGTFKETHAYTFFLNKNNYQYYYYQLNNVERNIYNSILNSIDDIILENKYIYFNITNLIQSPKSSHDTDKSTYQNLYVIFTEQLNEFRNFFNNAKYAARNDYPELSFIDWDALDIDFYQKGKLTLVHKKQILKEKTLFDSNLNSTVVTTEIEYENTNKYLYEGLTQISQKKIRSTEVIKDLIDEQTNFIYYDIIKDVFVDVPIVEGTDYHWTVSSLNYDINIIINNIIDNLYKSIKEFDYENVIFGKKNITDNQFAFRNGNEIYGLFKSGYATSINLAKAFKLAMDYIGIDCVLVWGKTTDKVKKENSDHSEMWNAINLFNKWYSIDLSFHYYKICKLEMGSKRGLKLDTFTNCQFDKRLNNDITDMDSDSVYTLLGSEVISNYLVEDSTVFTSPETYLLFPKLSQQNYELAYDETISNNYNVTRLNSVDSSIAFKNINNVNTKENINIEKRYNTKKYDMFVNANIKSMDFKINNQYIIENTILTYDIFTKNFDVKSMSYILVKHVQETKLVKMYLNNKKTDSAKRFKIDNNTPVNNTNVKYIKYRFSLSNIDNNENINTFYNNDNNHFTTLGMTELNGILINTEKMPVFYNNKTSNSEIDDINIIQENNVDSASPKYNFNSTNKNDNYTSFTIDNVISIENDYTYVPLTINYTTYQFIPGHSFININNDDISNQYVTFYLISVPISYWYNIFGENFSIGKEGFEEVVENGKIKLKNYNDWTNFLEKYKDKFHILNEFKYKYHDSSPPITHSGSSIDYIKSSPLPNYFLNLQTTNVTICYNQPLNLNDDELSVTVTYSITKPIMDEKENNVYYSIRNLKFNKKTNCVDFEFSPDLRISNIIYYFKINGLIDDNHLTPVIFSYIIYPESDYESQRNVLYQTSFNDKAITSKISYSTPHNTNNNLMFYDKNNNVFYRNDVLIESKNIREETQKLMKQLLQQKETMYNNTDINTEFLKEINIKTKIGASLKATTPFEILIPWSNRLKKFNYNTYKCYTFTKDIEGNPSNLSSCTLKFYSFGMITKIRSSQYIWIISYKSISDNEFSYKQYSISYSGYMDIFESIYNTNNGNINDQKNNFSDNDNFEKASIQNTDRNDIHYNTEQDICKTLEIISNQIMPDVKHRENVVIDNSYNCYFDLNTRFKYYCHDLERGQFITNENGKCIIKKKHDLHKNSFRRKNKHRNKTFKKKFRNSNNNKRDIPLYLETSDFMVSSYKIDDVPSIIPDYGLESTLIYFTVTPPENLGVKEISIIKKDTQEVMFTSSSNKKMIECINLNHSYRFTMPSYDIELSIEFASNNLKVEYIMIDDYQLNIVEGRYLYYVVVKDKEDITEKPISIKTDSPYVTYNISYFILNDEIYITLIAPNNEYMTYTIKYISKSNDYSDRSAVSMFYINKKALVNYPDNSYIFIYCNPDPSLDYNDLLDMITIKDNDDAKISSDVQGNKISVKVIAENNYNYSMYTIVPIDQSNDVYRYYCISSLPDNNLNNGDDKSNNKNNDKTSSAYTLRSLSSYKLNSIFIFTITIVLYLLI